MRRNIRRSGKGRKPTKSSKIIKAMGHELKVNPPKVLAKFSGAHRESIRRAIMFSKARRAGARLPAWPKKKAA